MKFQKKINLLNLILLLLSIFIFSCKSIPKIKTEEVENSEWLFTEENLQIIDCRKNIISKEFFKKSGIDIKSKKNPTFYAVKIPLNTNNLNIKILEENVNNSWKSFDVKTKAKSEKVKIAFNTNPFKKSKEPVGIVIKNKKIISEPVKKYSAILFFKEKNGFSAKIIKNQQNIPENVDFAVGGFFQTLENSNEITFKEFFDTRLALGITKKQELIIFSGKNLSFSDCNKILKFLNSENIIQLDGGSSVNLVINQNSVFKEFITKKVPVALGFEFK